MIKNRYCDPSCIVTILDFNLSSFSFLFNRMRIANIRLT